MQRGLDVNALVQRHNDSLLQVQPVVGADRHSQQPQAADCKDAAQQCQSLPATRAHGDSRGSLQQSVVKNKRSQRRNLEEEGEKKTGLVVEERQREREGQIHQIYTYMNTHIYTYIYEYRHRSQTHQSVPEIFINTLGHCKIITLIFMYDTHMLMV